MGSRAETMNFNTMSQIDVPQGRKGRHKQVVTKILSDLDQLPAGIALKVPLAELAERKENVRSALNRAINAGSQRRAGENEDCHPALAKWHHSLNQPRLVLEGRL